MDYLQEALAAGPRLTREIVVEAKEREGISRTSLERARKEMEAKAFRKQGAWWVCLKEDQAWKEAAGEGVGGIDGVDGLRSRAGERTTENTESTENCRSDRRQHVDGIEGLEVFEGLDGVEGLAKDAGERNAESTEDAEKIREGDAEKVGVVELV